MPQLEKQKVFFRPEEFFIGHTEKEDVCIPEMNGTILVRGNRIYIQDGASDIFLNDVLLYSDTCEFGIGDRIRTAGMDIVFLAEKIKINGITDAL